MTKKEFKTLNYGDLVYYVNNSGTAGLFVYQYIGLHNCHKEKEKKHVFISEYFLSTVCILDENIQGSRNLKALFLTEKEAINYKKTLID